MRTYYCVTSTYYGDGRVTSAIVDEVKAEKAPRNSYKSTPDRDIYTDWFGDLRMAKKCVSEAISA